MKLRTQVSLLLVVLALVLSGIMFAGFQLDKEAITDQQQAETLQTSTEIASGLDTRLESLERTVRLQATNPAVARHGTADQQQALAATVNETVFDGVSVIHRNGTMTGIEAGLDAETRSKLVGSDFGDRQYFQRAMGGETYVSKPVAADTGNYIVTVSTPIYQNGTVVGTLNAALHLQNSSFFSGVTSAANSHHGVTIQSPGGEVIYDREPTPATNLVTKNATVDETGWTVQVQTSRNVLASELQRITVYQTGAVGLVILLIAGIGHVLYTRTVRYHERLVDGFDKIQKQEYGVQVSDEATSEWQQLFTAFNELSRTLADYEAERTQQQKELQRERDRFSALFESIPEPAVMVETTESGTALKDVNEAFETTFGYDASEAIGSNINDLIVPDSQRGSGRAIDEKAAAGEQITREVRREASDGVRDFLLRSTLSRGEGDDVYFGVYIDITDRKQQKQELAKTNSILTSVLGNLPVGVLVEDTDGTITAANQTLVDVLGVSEPPEALIGRDCDRVVGELSDQFAEPDNVSARINEILATGEPVLDEEVRMADGRILSRSFVTYSTPSGTGCIWLYRDITAQKRRIRRLERQDFLFNRTQEMASLGIWEYDPETDEVFWSDGVRELHAVGTNEELTLQEWLEFYSPEDRKAIKETAKQVLDERGEYELTLRLRRDDGEVRDVRAHGEAIHDDGDEESGVKLRGVFQDITEQKARERELTRYETIIESMTDVAWIQDSTQDLVFVNERFTDAFGVTPETPESFQAALGAADLAPTDELNALDAVTDRVLNGSQDSARIELPLSLPEGRRVFDIRLNPITYDNGEINGVVGLARDITVQKEHEKRLSRLNNISRDLMQADTSQAIATVAVESAQELFGIPMSGYWVYDEEADVLTPVVVTDSARELLGEPPVLERGSSLAWEVFQSQEVTLFSDIPSQPARYNPETSIQSELILPVGDHGVLLLGATGEMAFDEADHSLATILAANVESALELATKQEQLLEQRTQLDLALEGGQLGVWDWDVQTDTVSFNEQWAAMLGYSLDEIEPNISAWSDRVHPEDLPMAEVALDAHFDRETEYYKCDHRMRSKSGDWIWVRDVGRVVERDDDGNPLRAVGIQQDITTDKQRELKLQDILEQTQRLMQSKTVTEAAEVAVEIADETLSFPLAGVYLDDGDGRLEPTAVTESVEERLGSEPTYVEGSDGRVVDRVVWDAYTAGQTQVIRNAEQEFPDLANQTPIQSGIIHPLATHGVFITAVDSPDGFDEFDQYLVELLAALLTTTVERIQQAQQLESQRDSLELLNQMVRHDIRNDLQVLVGYLDLAEEAADGAEKQYLQTALESADNAVELTKTARDLSEVMLQDETTRQPVSLRRVVSQQADDLRSADSGAVITLDESLRGVTIRADDLFDSVIRNLLKNAVQHTRKDRPEIMVSATVEDGRVELRIADNGPGVPDSQKKSIFGKGEKGLDSEGTGIGLYLVNTVVESYGGAVWVEDNDPEGAVFVLDLPQETT
ncbi:putative light and redox sensing histidine kinase [Haloferax elongans ATCC BAA-1513]|uniref:histidine kinase n=1 Tax=Haloferax elongans ATCC BAA-1513 TaxID=1230453 RepID=M0HWK1_HALEO|nr:PAS domain S-box protein [Haloferax elongans]ELZ88985.1 putative light and redox sensing histidine kinase [Haloferax elongans ATCC BAA-1513]